MSLKCSS